MSALKPIYPFADTTEPVTLRKGHVVAEYSSVVFEGASELKLVLVPRPSIRIAGCLAVQGNKKSFKIPFFEPCVRFTFDGQELEGLTVSCRPTGGGVDLTFCPNKLVFTTGKGDKKNLHRVVFHLFGYLQFYKVADQILTLESGSWSIQIHQRRNINELHEKIRTDSVTRLTHVAELTRRSGEAFSADEATQQLRLLTDFLTFVHGWWCPLVCAGGFDADGTCVWQEVNPPRPPGAINGTWCSTWRPQDIQSLFPLFAALWHKSDSWQDCLHEVIYWYVNANGGDGVIAVDAAVILVQAALERLSYEYAVNDRHLTSADAFKPSGLRGSDKLRLLLSSLGIPIDIPDATEQLKKQRAWKDGPHAFVAVRNAQVHPEAKDRELVRQCLTDSYELGMWYLELALLSVCGYDGSYRNRLTCRFATEVELVPWCSDKAP